MTASRPGTPEWVRARVDEARPGFSAQFSDDELMARYRAAVGRMEAAPEYPVWLQLLVTEAEAELDCANDEEYGGGS